MLQLLSAEDAHFERILKAITVGYLPVSISRSRALLEAVVVAIEDKRREKIKTLAIDPLKLAHLRIVVENALLTPPAGISVFRGFKIQRTPRRSSTETFETSFPDVPKGAFTEPAMGAIPPNMDQYLARGVQSEAVRRIWRKFFTRKRRLVAVSGGIEEKLFWKTLSEYRDVVGTNPALLLGRSADQSRVRDWVIFPDKRPDWIEIKIHPAVGEKRLYIASINGVDVYRGGGDYPILFSAGALTLIEYQYVSQDGSIMDLHFEPNVSDVWTGSVLFRFAQALEWNESPTIEFKRMNVD
jgi:hypothetical protein